MAFNFLPSPSELKQTFVIRRLTINVLLSAEKLCRNNQNDSHGVLEHHEFWNIMVLRLVRSQSEPKKITPFLLN
jgi:hypothetical protein